MSETPLQKAYQHTRALSEELVSGLSEADAQIQSMEDASPAKWHLAHTSWFFETLVLARQPGYRPFHPQFNYLFNSYYQGIGAQYARPQRGLLSRPSLEEILQYRRHVDCHMAGVLSGDQGVQLAPIIELGIHHEQQHQELLLMDIKHAFFHNPLYPAYSIRALPEPAPQSELRWLDVDEGLYCIGHDNNGFAFDNEQPRHQQYLQTFKLASRLVTNGEYRQFIRDGGYDNPLLWLSDGWAWRQRSGRTTPLYWLQTEQGWQEFTLHGCQPLEDNRPLVHLSYYEAQAFAQWAGCRLPFEAEWEAAATDTAAGGQFLDLNHLHPITRVGRDSPLSGSVWQWTQSAYGPYPGFKPFEGEAAEYNGKFMCNQLVLRGGACVTPASHFRISYRNFFYPHQAWQFCGIRLAKSA